MSEKEQVGRQRLHRDDDADVVIVGAGPTGLTAATDLAARGIRTIVLDAQPAGANTSRAAVVHAHTLEVLERVGVAERLDRRGVHVGRFTIRDRDRILVPVRFDRLPTKYPYTLMVSQADTEQALRERLAELGGSIRWQCKVVAAGQSDAGAFVTLENGEVLRSRYLVGADGMHSKIREAAGIAFRGDTYAQSFSLADVRLGGGVSSDEVVLYFSPAGLVVVAPLPDGVHRIVATTDSAPEHPDIAYVQALLDERGPRRARAIVREVLWGSRFRVHHRVAESFQAGRILLAGDAAHVHSPAGGQGMNTGIQDAVVLSQALARALASDNDDALRAYQVARKPVAEQVVRLADGLTRLATMHPAMRPLRNAILHLLSYIPAFRNRLAWRLSGLLFRSP